MPSSRLILLIACVALVISACGPRLEEPLPTKGVPTLPPALPTNTPAPPATATPLPSATPLPTATQPPSAKILLYEDTGDIGPWVKEVLDDMSLTYTYVTGSGDFLEQLQSDTKWGLIIIAAESRSSIQGVIWELLNKKITFENASLIAEMWSIHLIAEGKIKPFLSACGVTVQKNLPKAVPVYILDAEHPIFNEPNTGFTLEKPAPYWSSEAVDLMQLIPYGSAKFLAGTDPKDTTARGVITTCFQGRVILQTFLNHDYPKPAIQALWENYLTYMLRRFR